MSMRAAQQPVLGVLGGMGPLATVDFLGKLTQLLPVRRDQDHLPWITLSQPGTPDRSCAIQNRDDSPLPWLAQGAAWLAAQGVQLVVVPCNTSHYWYEQMQAACAAPIAHIADAALTELRSVLPPQAGPVAVLATRGVVKAGIYRDRLAAAGYQVADLEEAQQAGVDSVIHKVKCGMVAAARDELRELEALLRKRGIGAAVLGCTELPLAHEKRMETGLPVIDTSAALAKEALRRLGYL